MLGVSALAAWVALVVVGQADDGGTVDIVARLLQYGVVGGVCLCLMFGILVPKWALDRAIADKQRAEDQRDALTASYQTAVIPALVEFNRTADALLDLGRGAVMQRAREPRRPRDDDRRP